LEQTNKRKASVAVIVAEVAVVVVVGKKDENEIK
jgi:hypothetical protein